jgi:hypothetical protein
MAGQAPGPRIGDTGAAGGRRAAAGRPATALPGPRGCRRPLPMKLGRAVGTADAVPTRRRCV